jgi:hypothetical protein
VGEKQCGSSRSAQHLGNLGDASSPEANSGEIQPLAVELDLRASVLQHRDSARFECRRHLAIVIVIAKNGERAETRRGEWRKKLGDRVHEATLGLRHVVAAQHDQVGFRSKNYLDRPRHVVGGHAVAVMNVGKKSDPKTIERGRQPGDRQVLLDLLQMVSRVQRSIRGDSGGETNTRCGKRLQRGAPRDAH